MALATAERRQALVEALSPLVNQWVAEQQVNPAELLELTAVVIIQTARKLSETPEQIDDVRLAVEGVRVSEFLLQVGDPPAYTIAHVGATLIGLLDTLNFVPNDEADRLRRLFGED
jgi:hypothetical protein